MPEMSVLSSRGDDKHIWDPDDEKSVELAEKSFNDHIKKGFIAFEVGRGGQKTSRRVEKFDRDLGKLIFVPEVAGG